MTSLRIKTSIAATLGLVAFAWASGCSSSGDDDSSGGNLTGGTTGSGASGGSTGAGASGGSGVGAGSGVGGSTSTAGSGAGGASGSTGSGGTGGTEALVTVLCGDTGCACENGLDDDGDGQTDGFDSECTGPLDDDEGTFATGISGDNMDPKWQDCFFDGNSGAGDDDCRYHTDCMYGDLPATDSKCIVTDFCLEYCAARTPNGCDCFGCCEVDGPGGTRINVYLDPGCSSETIADEQACPRCEQSTQCSNTCGECELCLGKTVEDLPASCGPSVPDGGTPVPVEGGAPPPPPNYTCDQGGTVCASTGDCAANEYCAQGCCIPILR